MNTKNAHWVLISCLLVLSAIFLSACAGNDLTTPESLGQAWLDARLANDCAKMESFFEPESVALEEFSAGCALMEKLVSAEVETITYKAFPGKDYGGIYYKGVFNWEEPGGRTFTTNTHGLVVHENGGRWYAGEK